VHKRPLMVENHREIYTYIHTTYYMRKTSLYVNNLLKYRSQFAKIISRMRNSTWTEIYCIFEKGWSLRRKLPCTFMSSRRYNSNCLSQKVNYRSSSATTECKERYDNPKTTWIIADNGNFIERAAPLFRPLTRCVKSDRFAKCTYIH